MLQRLCFMGRGARFSDVTGSESCPVAVVVTDELRPGILLQASAFSFSGLAVKCRDSLEREYFVQRVFFSVWLDDKHLLSRSTKCSISKVHQCP
jgi:hypothetical protein